MATLAIVALQQARANARDAKRVADVKQLSTALEMYFNDHQLYPATMEDLRAEGYMEQLPEAPTPADEECEVGENEYTYTVNSERGDYEISFCTGKQVSDMSPGVLCMTPGGITTNCNSTISCLDNPELCSWQELGVNGVSDGARSSYVLQIYNGVPYVAYTDSDNSARLTVAKYNGSSWETIGNPGFSASSVNSSPALYVYNGTPYVAYYTSLIDSYKAVVSNSTGREADTSLYIYEGTIYLAYRDYDNYSKVTVLKFNKAD